MASTTQSQQQKAFDKLTEQYKDAKQVLANNPGNHDDGYNEIAHQYAMKAKAAIDLCLMKMIMVKQDEVLFATVDLMNGVYAINYNPYRNEFDDQESMEFDIIDAPVYKPTAVKFYDAASEGKIKWLLTVMVSDVNMLFVARLMEDIESGFYKAKVPDFAKKVASLMRNCPHKKMETYSHWITAFLAWLSGFESDVEVVVEIIDAVLKALQTVFYKNDREKFIKKGNLEEKVGEYPSIPSWEQCSKEVHKAFSGLNFKVKENMGMLEIFRAKALAAREAKKAALEKAKGSQKRKAEEPPSEEATSAKKPRLEKDVQQDAEVDHQ